MVLEMPTMLDDGLVSVFASFAPCVSSLSEARFCAIVYVSLYPTLQRSPTAPTASFFFFFKEINKECTVVEFVGATQHEI
jgi:hypothetical protein